MGRHVDAGRAAHAALRWLGRDRTTRGITYGDLSALTGRFANVLASLCAARGERVFSLLCRVPGLCIAALGTLKAGCVFPPPGFPLRPEIDGRAPRPDRACLHGRSADPLSKAPHGRGTAQRGKNCRRRAASHGTLVGIFRMPSLGADKEAGTLVEWLRQPAAPPARIAAPISRSAPRLSHWARPRRYKAVSRHPPLPETRHRAGARPHVGIRQRTGWRGAFHGRRSPANS